MNKKSTYTLFCDETGNTGNRFLDLDQPVYAEGGWVVANRCRTEAAEAILDIERQFNFGARELKGADLVRKAKGRLLMRKACEAIGRKQGLPFIYVVEKRYAVCTKIVETYFDHYYNPLVPASDTWDPEKRQSDAQFFYKRDGTLIDQFAESYRTMDASALETNVRNYVTLLNACGMRDQAARVAAVLPNIQEEIRIESSVVSLK